MRYVSCRGDAKHYPDSAFIFISCTNSQLGDDPSHSPILQAAIANIDEGSLPAFGDGDLTLGETVSYVRSRID